MGFHEEDVIDQLKQCLTRQLEAYHAKDGALYDELEEQILSLEKRL